MSEQQNIKEILKQEYIKCATDPGHFMRKYCHIQHPQRGRVLFNLYPFQDKVLKLWKENPYSIVLKSRQLGISTLAAGYSLSSCGLNDSKNLAVHQSQKVKDLRLCDPLPEITIRRC